MTARDVASRLSEDVVRCLRCGSPMRVHYLGFIWPCRFCPPLQKSDTLAVRQILKGQQ